MLPKHGGYFGIILSALFLFLLCPVSLEKFTAQVILRIFGFFRTLLYGFT